MQAVAVLHAPSRREFLKLAAAGAAALAIPARAAGLSCLRAPYLQNVSASGADILWTLSSKADTVLQLIGDSGDVHTVTPDVTEFTPDQTGLPSSYFQYRASAAGLNTDAGYSYAILSGGQPIATPVAGALRLRTAAGGSSFTFLHIADSGTGADVQRQLAALMGQENASLVLGNGDLAYDLGTFASVEANYFGVYRDMMAQVPFFASLGNHEYYTDAGGPSLAARVTPDSGVPAADRGHYYSFDWGNVHFVALDSNAPLTRADSGDLSMLTWLENDLRATRKFWRVVFFHHPGYATGIHQNEPEAGRVRQYIVPILERYGVQLVFNGHEHNYQRTLPLLGGQVTAPDSGGIVYVTGGGGGQVPYSSSPADFIAQILSVNQYVRAQVSGSTITVAAVAPDGSIADSTRLAPQPRIAGPIVESAALSPRLASGGLASIFGSNFSAGVSVALNGTALPVLYADANQINVQIPAAFSGAGTLEVRTPNGAASISATVAPVAPAIFLTADGYALAEHADGTLVAADSPARAGETITLILTGLGAVVADVNVLIGGTAAPLVSAGPDATYAGVYEVRAQIPAGLPFAAIVQVIAGGAASNGAPLVTA